MLRENRAMYSLWLKEQKKKPNAVTKAVMEDIEKGKNLKRFKTPEELFAELEAD